MFVQLYCKYIHVLENKSDREIQFNAKSMWICRNELNMLHD